MIENYCPTPKEEVEKLGGSDKKDWKVYKIPDEKPYYDKKDHSERSKANQPNHNKHK